MKRVVLNMTYSSFSATLLSKAELAEIAKALQNAPSNHNQITWALGSLNRKYLFFRKADGSRCWRAMAASQANGEFISDELLQRWAKSGVVQLDTAC